MVWLVPGLSFIPEVVMHDIDILSMPQFFGAVARARTVGDLGLQPFGIQQEGCFPGRKLA